MNININQIMFNEYIHKVIKNIQKNKFIIYIFVKNRILFGSMMCLYIYYFLKKKYSIFKYVNFNQKFKSFLTKLTLNIPFVKKRINEKIYETKKSIKEDMNKPIQHLKYLKQLPINGLKSNSINEIINKYHLIDNTNSDINGISGTIYKKDENHTKLMNSIFSTYFKSNPLHPDVFPALRKMESEIVKMCLDLYNNKNGYGCLTSGGTESIMLACYAYKKYFNKRNPEIIVIDTAHAAFDKACEYFDIKLIKVPVNEKDEPDLTYLKNSINSQTICIVGSAPGFPHGIMDPTKTLSEIAYKHNIGFHIDCCLGGFILPFLEIIDEKSLFDFRLKGVTSVSADLHKYGYCPKGISVLMYRDKKHFNSQFFVQPNWSGGIYATSTMLGSRSGNIIALSYATMLHYGYNGYKNYALQISDTTIWLRDRIKSLQDVYVIGEPEVCVVGIGSKSLDIFEVNDNMKKKGWNLNALQFPSSIHLCVTHFHTNDKIKFKFLDDLEKSISETKKNIGNTKKGSSIYGTSQKISHRGIIDNISREYLNCLYEL